MGKKSDLGIGPNAPKTTNSEGGSQSEYHYRFDLIDPLAMFALAAVLDQGAKTYGENNWRKIPIEDHINRAIGHLYAHLGEESFGFEDQDDHLDHALCRTMFAVAMYLGGGQAKSEPTSTILQTLEKQTEELHAITAEYARRYFRTPETRTRFRWSGHTEAWTCASCGVTKTAYTGCYTNTKVNICHVCFEAEV